MAQHIARRQPSDLAGSGWYEMLERPGPALELEGARTADWIIVGAGFAGLAAARQLTRSRPGERIALIDAQRVGWGAAGRNSGFMIDLPHDLSSEAYGGERDRNLAEIALNRTAIAFARAFAEEAGLPKSVFDACGKYHGATDGHGIRTLRSFERHLDELGEPYSKLDADDMKRITGTDYYAGGSHMPGAVIIQPAAFVRALAASLGKDVTLHENSPVLRFETGREHTVHTPKGRVTAPRLILTVNGHIESFGFFARQLMHIFLYGSMTRRLTAGEVRALGGEPAWALIPADPRGSTIRRLHEDRILVRNSATWNPGMSTTARDIARFGRQHDASFKARFPMLADVTMEYRWGGHLCLSLNNAPAFGEIAERVYSACCCNGLGATKGTLGGIAIADLASGAGGRLVDFLLAQPGPSRLYPEPFMSLGAHAKLWWMQKRAGRDK
ncbi:MAG: FAD-dependent oxidoreductase [Rhizobiales bacterium]|nr:FAD-dependent oxidoreductase [Hyphomicrobiales bacterium]